MLTIRNEDGGLILDPNGILPLPIRSQLVFLWGFKVDKGIYKNTKGQIDELLPKLTLFLKTRNIKFDLSEECKLILKNVLSTTQQVNEIIENGRKYKDGKLHDSITKDLKNYWNMYLARKLKTHQIKAATHMYLVKNGANFSVPGSGKTSVVLSVYKKLKDEKKVNTLFIVGPSACFEPWRNEFISTLGYSPKTYLLAGGGAETRHSKYFEKVENTSELILTSYQTLLHDSDLVKNFLNRKGIDAFVVIDEAHYIKRIEGNWAKSTLNIAKSAKYRCILTGTPTPQSYSDFFNLFDFLWPENNPLTNNLKIKIKYFEQNKKIDEAKEILKECISPLFYRVRKNDLGLKPATFHEPILLEMNKYEKLLYDAIEKRIIDLSREDYIRDSDLLSILRRGRLMRLRQCCSYTSLLLSAIENYSEELILDKSELMKVIKNYDQLETPAKIEFLLEFAKKHKDEKILIWSNFINTINKISKKFTENNIYNKTIQGSTPIERESVSIEETREKIREEFLNPKSGLNILIANPGACAESISLHTTCHIAIYYDSSFNCAQYLQSLDRIHRVGGSEMVDTHYFFLHYKNTIDPYIFQSLNSKASKMYDLIEQDFAIYSLNLDSIDEDTEMLSNYLMTKTND